MLNLKFGRENYDIEKFEEEIRKAEAGSSKGGAATPILGVMVPSMLPNAEIMVLWHAIATPNSEVDLNFL